MPEEPGRHKIRLRLPDGAEFEAEGSPEFVRGERQEFLSGLRTPPVAAPRPEAPRAGEPDIAWEAITERKGRDLQLRAKLAGDKSQKDACLVLLAASHKLLNLPKPTAAQLAKWLRGSGYPVLRMDRALQDGIERGELLSSGSRRARRYELTAPGRLKAWLLAEQLTLAVLGTA